MVTVYVHPNVVNDRFPRWQLPFKEIKSRYDQEAKCWLLCLHQPWGSRNGEFEVLINLRMKELCMACFLYDESCANTVRWVILIEFYRPVEPQWFVLVHVMLMRQNAIGLGGDKTGHWPIHPSLRMHTRVISAQSEICRECHVRRTLGAEMTMTRAAERS